MERATMRSLCDCEIVRRRDGPAARLFEEVADQRGHGDKVSDRAAEA